MTRKMQRFAVETAGRARRYAVSDGDCGYVRLWLWRSAIGKCNGRLLEWAQGGSGLQVVAPCFCEMQWQIAKHLITVG